MSEQTTPPPSAPERTREERERLARELEALRPYDLESPHHRVPVALVREIAAILRASEAQPAEGHAEAERRHLL